MPRRPRREGHYQNDVDAGHWDVEASDALTSTTDAVKISDDTLVGTLKGDEE